MSNNTLELFAQLTASSPEHITELLQSTQDSFEELTAEEVERETSVEPMSPVSSKRRYDSGDDETEDEHEGKKRRCISSKDRNKARLEEIKAHANRLGVSYVVPNPKYSPRVLPVAFSLDLSLLQQMIAAKKDVDGRKKNSIVLSEAENNIMSYLILNDAKTVRGDVQALLACQHTITNHKQFIESVVAFRQAPANRDLKSRTIYISKAELARIENNCCA